MKITTLTSGQLANLLPRIYFDFGGEGIEFNSETNSELKTKLGQYAIEHRPDLTTYATEKMEDEAYDSFEYEMKMIVQKWFICKFGKAMISKFPGKTIDGNMFTTGAPIIYWSNGVDKAVVLK